ncbi:MAG: radical SAM protein [Candidatus Diapherotrites archaeon]|nr:radical SAM protein [Candidatus Diapherotrites archaeon]
MPNYPNRIDTFRKGVNLSALCFTNNRRRVPLDVAYPAAVLRQKGYDVFIEDSNATKSSIDQVLKQIEAFSPEILFISSIPITRWQCPPDPKVLIKIVKEIRKKFDGEIGLIGPHGTALPEHTLHSMPIDFVIRGEPDLVCLEYVKKGKKTKGVSYLSDGKMVSNENFMPIQDLDSLPMPAYDLLHMDLYSVYLIVSSRGCPAACIFCNKTMYGQGFRRRGAKNIYGEMEYLIKKFGKKEFYFQDLDFCFDRKKVEELSKFLIRKKLNVKWMCSARVTSVDGPLLKLMKSAGCHQINFGLETASTKLLKTIKKGITLESVEKTIELCEKIGIYNNYNALFGFPGENKLTMLDNVNFIAKFSEYKYASLSAGFRLINFPGSPLFEQAVKEKGGVDDPWAFSIESGGLIGNDFKTEGEYIKYYKKMKRLIMLKKVQNKYGKLFFFNPKFFKLVLFKKW